MSCLTVKVWFLCLNKKVISSPQNVTPIGGIVVVTNPPPKMFEHWQYWSCRCNSCGTVPCTLHACAKSINKLTSRRTPSATGASRIFSSLPGWPTPHPQKACSREMQSIKLHSSHHPGPDTTDINFNFGYTGDFSRGASRPADQPCLLSLGAAHPGGCDSE